MHAQMKTLFETTQVAFEPLDVDLDEEGLAVMMVRYH